MASQKKMCPHCGGTMFAAKIIHAGIVMSEDDGSFSLQKENPTYEIEIMKCGRCKESVTNEELIEGVTCAKCGNVVNANELDEDGLCVVCHAKKNEAELVNATPDQLIRMLLAARQEAKTVHTSVENTAVENTAAANEPVSDTEDKKKRKARRKAGTEDTDPQEEVFQPSNTMPDVSVPVETDSASEIADMQTAPWPDVEQADTMAQSPVQIDIPDSTDEKFGGNNFPMYDNSSDEKF